MKTLAFVNRKGGVGKSMTCYNVAAALAEAGEAVLVVDADPQASISGTLLGRDEAAAIPPERTFAGLFGVGRMEPAATILKTRVERVDVFPGHDLADAYNLPCERGTLGTSNLPTRLHSYLDDPRLESRYGYVLVDCPPNLCLLTYNALYAADLVVVPFAPEDYGAQGIPSVQAAVETARRFNPDLVGLSLVINRVGAFSIHKAFELMVRETYGAQVLPAVVPMRIDFLESLAARQPVVEFAPDSFSAESIRAVATQLVGLVGSVLPAPVRLFQPPAVEAPAAIPKPTTSKRRRKAAGG